MTALPALTPDDRAALVVLAGLPGIGPATLLGCLEAIAPTEALAIVASGGPTAVASLQDAFDREARSRRGPGAMAAAARATDPSVVYAAHLEHGCEIVVRGDAGYPDLLLDDPAPPAVLFVQGAAHLLNESAVAIVGTRSATRLGREWSGQLAAGLAAHGIHVVSGLALGIDGAAHHAVLESGEDGCAIGVIAGGLDRPYPHRHRELHGRVAANGVLVTEAPLGCEPRRWRFPARNRIIAGLAEAVVVVESASAGGSMLTAAEAIDRNRPVLAVPGHPASPSAQGTLDLIADGAVPVRDLDDVLVALGRGGERLRARDLREVDRRPTRRPAVDAVLADLEHGPRSLGEIVASTGSTVAEVASALSDLEVAGDVARHGSWFEPVPRGSHARKRQVRQ